MKALWNQGVHQGSMDWELALKAKSIIKKDNKEKKNCNSWNKIKYGKKNKNN